MEDLGDYFKRHLDLHKKKGTKHFGGLLNAAVKKERADKLKEHRKQTRDSLISKRRNIPVATPTPQKPTKQPGNPSKRLQMLADWKAKKLEVKKEKEKKTKPIFKVGTVSAPVGLPNWENVNVEIKGKKFRGLSFAPENHKFQPPANVKPLYFQNDIKKQAVGRSPITTRSKAAKPSGSQVSPWPKAKLEKAQKRKRKSKSKKASEVLVKKPEMSSEESTENEDFKPLRIPKSKASSDSLEEISSCSNTSIEVIRSSSPEKSSNNTSQSTPIVLKKANKQHNKTEDIEEVKNFSLKLKTPKKSAKKNGDSVIVEEASCGKESKSKASKKKSKSSNISEISNIKKSAEKSGSSAKLQEAIPERESRSKASKKKLNPNISPISNPISSEQSVESQYETVKESVVVFKTPSKPARNKKNEEKNSCKTRVKTPARKRKLADEETKPQRNTRSKTCDSQERDHLNPSNISLESNSCLSSPEKENLGSPVLFKTPSKLTQGDQIYISPFVTISRGKDSAKKEFALRRSKAFSPNKDFAAHTSPKAGGAYFTRMLDNEISRLEELCEIWRLYKNSENLPEEACSMIDVVLGQSHLLINKKFQQFRGLIEQCEDSNSEKLVTCEDLHGFWDMIYIQVENLDKRFENLNTLKAANWQEVVPEKEKTKLKKPVKAKKVGASSSLKEAIKSARMKQSSSDENQSKSPFNIELCTKKKTPQLRNSALLSVRSGEKRKSSPGLVMLKVAQMVKDIELGTPAKSILKTDSTRSTAKTRSVLFKDFAEEKSESSENDQNIHNSMTSPHIQAKPVARRSTRLSRQKLF